MRRFGLALGIAALTAGCSSFSGFSTFQSKKAAPSEFTTTEKGFADATTLFENQRYDQAARICEATIRIRPYHVPSHLLLARSYHAAGKDDSAIPRYRTLLNLSPNHVEGLTELAAIYRRRNESDQAVTLLERAFECTGGREDIALALAMAWEEVGDFDRALDVRLSHLKSHPSCVEAASHAIRRLRERGDAVRACEVADAAIRAGVRPEDLPKTASDPPRQAEQPIPEPPNEEAFAPCPEGTPPDEPLEEPSTRTEEPEPADVPTPTEEPRQSAKAAPAPPPSQEKPQPPPPKPKPPLPKAEPPKPPEEKPRAPKPDPPAPKKQAPPAAPRAQESVVEKPARLSPEAQKWIEEGDRSFAEGLAAAALEAYRRSKEHGGPESILATRIERAMKSREEAQKAVRDLLGGLHQAQDPAEHRLKLAAAYLQDGRYLEAQLLLIQVTMLAPNCGEAYYLLGIAYEHRADWQQAADAFRKARKLCPGTALDVQAGFHLEEIATHLDH